MHSIYKHEELPILCINAEYGSRKLENTIPDVSTLYPMQPIHPADATNSPWSEFSYNRSQLNHHLDTNNVHDLNYKV